MICSPRNLALTAVVALAASSAVGQTALVTYDFNNADANRDFNATATNGGGAPLAIQEFNPSDQAVGVTGSNLFATGGGTTNGVRLGSNTLTYGVTQGDVLVVGTTGSAALSLDDYFSFTVTPDAGQQLDLNGITVEAARGGGSDRGFEVRSSLDNYTAVLTGSETVLIPSQRPTLTDFTVDLSAAAFDAVGAPVEFRVYVQSTGTNNSLEFDNLVVLGSANPVPEPGSLGLVGLGVLALARGRKASVA